MDECRESANPCSRAITSRTSRRTSVIYDLRLPETRVAQADMAREYGIEAFCYYHYWFAGHRLIERPFNEVLASGQAGFPVLPVLGESDLERDMAWRTEPRA